MQSPLGIFSLAIVVTHHAPSYKGTVAPKYIGNEISSGFCTDLVTICSDCLWLVMFLVIRILAAISWSIMSAVWCQISLGMFKKRPGLIRSFVLRLTETSRLSFVILLIDWYKQTWRYLLAYGNGLKISFPTLGKSSTVLRRLQQLMLMTISQHLLNVSSMLKCPSRPSRYSQMAATDILIGIAENTVKYMNLSK